MLLSLILTPNPQELCNFDPSGRDRGGDESKMVFNYIREGDYIREHPTLNKT